MSDFNYLKKLPAPSLLCCFAKAQKHRAQKPLPIAGSSPQPFLSSTSHTNDVFSSAAALKTMQESDAIVSSYNDKNGK